MEAAERAVTWGVGVQTAVSSLQRQRERETLEEKRNAEKCTNTVPFIPVSRLPSTLYVYLACV